MLSQARNKQYTFFYQFISPSAKHTVDFFVFYHLLMKKITALKLHYSFYFTLKSTAEFHHQSRSDIHFSSSEVLPASLLTTPFQQVSHIRFTALGIECRRRYLGRLNITAPVTNRTHPVIGNPHFQLTGRQCCAVRGGVRPSRSASVMRRM
jgi:hypothetical protein